MSIERALTIDELYDRVSGADIALSAEAPLTLALDRRVDRPRIGRLSATPRSHASGDLVPDDHRPLLIELVEETDLPWKQAARSLELCLDCWNRTGRLEAILEHPEFDTAAIRTTVECLREIPSSYRELACESIDSGDDVYVIDPKSLTALDRSLLSDQERYEPVSPFGTGTWTLPELNLYPSATAIVDDIIDVLDVSSAEQVGIVLDQSTVYSPLVEAALDANGIPYQGGPGFIDDATVRLFVRLLQAGYSGGGTTVGELRPLLAAAGLEVSREHDNQRLDGVDAAWTAEFEALRETIRTGTFADALETVEDIAAPTGRSELSTLRSEIEDLGLLTAEVTADRVDQLTYYLQTFDVPVERDRDGVLLTDAASTAYVDRPVVFYLGLGEGWAQTPPDYPWVDSEAFVERDMRRFELLVQNGRQQYFLVQDSMAGETVSPCVYLRELLEESFERFSDLPHVERHRPTIASGAEPFEAAEPPDHDPIETVSQSTLKRLVNCPREQYFHRLVDTPESLPMARGTVLHEAAELYVNHPEFVAQNRDDVVATMCDQLQAYLSDVRREVMRTRLNVGLEVATQYIDANQPTEASFETYGSPRGENDLADRLGLEVDSPVCERWFEATDLGGHGYVDLLIDRETLVDFKTGSKRSARDVQKQGRLDPVHDRPDFQVLLYLAQHRRECPDETIWFRFVYLLEAVHEWVKGDAPPVEDLVTTITYVPCSFPEFVRRREVFDDLTDYADSNARCRVLDTLGFERYREFFTEHEFPREDDQPDVRSATRDAFEALAREEVGEYKYVREGCEKIFDDLAKTPPGYYLEDDLDEFEAFLEERITELNEYRTSRFPVSFGDEEPNWDRVDHRDLVLSDR